jgi:putative Holliday junction resolvase
MKYLAIDYGEKRIGLAVSDESGEFAWPHGVRERTGSRRDVEGIIEAVRGLGIEGIVCGLPRATSGGQGQSEPAVRAFVESLQSALRAGGITIEIEWWDERFSTKEAHGQMRHLGISQRRGREATGSDSVDARAAAVILQGFLERRRNPHRVLEDAALAGATPTDSTPENVTPPRTGAGEDLF